MLLYRGLIKLLFRRLPFTTSRQIFILPGISIHGLDQHHFSVDWYSWALWPTVYKSETPSIDFLENFRVDSYLTELGFLLCRSSLSMSCAGAFLKCVWQHAPVLEAFLRVDFFWVAVNPC